ncbi:MAG: YihY/virulence factor BrkB family protein [Acidimicrobiales bacterium]|nr:YihY/virulence factor BrkB family protein [Acidimicrobiales bacterium]MCB9374043.1 YihY/virulence factor BrkB family protein [Microthrixaceae bacterium]
MNVVERQVRRLDHVQRRHPALAFPWAVAQKFGNDRAGAHATRIAYQGLFSLFPLLLLLTTILGFLLEGNPSLQQDLLASALADFPILGTQLQASAQPLRGNGLALAIGIGGTLYGALGVGEAAQAAMNSIWNIPYVEWPNFFLRRLRALAAVLLGGVAVLGSGAITLGAGRVASGWDRPLAYAGGALLALGAFLVAFRLLTATALRWRDVALGAALATAFWQGLQLLGSWYVTRTLSDASDTYGFFAIVIALLSWMYLGAQLTLLAVEINVVHAHHLWPRSITQPPLTDGDRATFSRLARMEQRRPEYLVSVAVTPEADVDPLLDEAAAEAEAGKGDGDGDGDGDERAGPDGDEGSSPPPRGRDADAVPAGGSRRDG